MEEGDAAWLEADAMEVRLEAVLLEMPATVAKLADPEEGARLDAMSFAHAPSALITQLLVRPVPRTVDGLLNASDMTGVKGGCGGGEGVSDVATEASVGVCPREATSGLPQLKAIVRELLSEVG